MPVESDVQPINVAEIVRHHLALVTLLGLVGLVLGFAAGTRVEVTPSATTSILVNPLEGNPFYPSSRGEQLINLGSEAQALRSNAVAAMVAEAVDSDLTEAQLLSGVTVTVPTNTQILDVTYSAGSEDRALQLSQSFADAFLEFRRQRAQSRIDEQAAQLDARIEEARVQLDQLALQVSNAETGSPAATVAQQQMDSLAAQINTLSTSRAELSTISQDPGSVVTPAALDGAGPLGLKTVLPLVGALAGLIGGLVLAIARSRGDDRIHRPADIRDLGVHVVGTIGWLDPTADALEYRSDAEDDYRRVRVALLALETRRPFTLLVASATGSSRSPLSAVDLATSFARSGLDTIVIDATSRSEGPATRMGVEGPGLTEVLLGDTLLANVLSPVAPLLRVLTPGRDVTSVSDMFVSDEMTRLLLTAKDDCDVVVLAADSIQLGDAQSLANMAEAVVVEADESRTTRAEIRRAARSLEMLTSSFVGTIFVAKDEAARRVTFRPQAALHQRQLPPGPHALPRGPIALAQPGDMPPPPGDAPPPPGGGAAPDPSPGGASTFGGSAPEPPARGAVFVHDTASAPPPAPGPTPGVSDSTENQLGRIARGGALNLFGAVISAGTSFAVVAVIANSFPAESAGMLFSATSLFLMLAALASLGTDTGLARFMLRYEAEGRHGETLIGLRAALVPVATLSLSLAAALFVLAGQIAPRIGLDDPSGATILRVAAVAIPFASLSDLSLATTRAFGRMRPSVVVENIGRSILQVGAVAVVALLGAGAVELTYAWMAPYAVAAILSAGIARRLLRRRQRSWPTHAHRPAKQVRREFWQYTWPRSIARVCQMVLQRADIVLIAALIDARAAAVYTAATRFVVLGQFASTAIQRVLQPRFTDLLARDRLDTVREVFKISTAWSMSLSWPLYLVAAVAAPLYLQIFGDGYQDEGRPVVVIMAVAMMVAIAAGPLDTLLLMSGGSAASLFNTATSLVANIGLGLLLIPRWGISGAAVAWAAAVVIRNGLAFWQVHRAQGLTPFSRGSTIVALASVTCFAGPILVVRAYAELSLPLLGLCVAGGAAGYAISLWSARRPLALRSMRALLRRGSGSALPAAA